MNLWVPLAMFGALVVAYLACDVMYWIGYFDGKRSTNRREKQ